jgi:hypothetical protein
VLCFLHTDLVVGWGLEMLPLQTRKRAPKLAVTDLVTPGQQCRKRRARSSLRGENGT